MLLVGGSEIGMKSRFQCPGKWNHPVLVSFAIVNGDGALVEIEILGSEV